MRKLNGDFEFCILLCISNTCCQILCACTSTFTTVPVVSPSSYVYWTDLHTSDPSVERAYLNGSNREEVPHDGQVKSPTSIAIDPQTDLIYWTDLDDDGVTDLIFKYDGERGEDLRINSLRYIRGLAVHGNHIYWTHEGDLGRANKLNGYDQEVVVKANGLQGLTAVNLSVEYGM